MKKNLLFAALAVMTMSCQKESADANFEGETKKVTISVAMDQSADSRVAIDGNAWAASWEAGDKLYSVQPKYWQAEFACFLETFTMVGEPADGGAAEFEGSASTMAQKMRLIYSKSSIVNTVDILGNPKLIFKYNIASQNGSLEKSMLISDDLYTIGEDIAPVMMKHIGGFMTVKVALCNQVEGYSLTKLQYCNVPVAAKLNLNDAGVNETVTETSDITVTFAEPIAVTGESISANFNIIPFELAAGAELTVKLTFAKDGESKEVVYTKKNTGAAVSFGRAQHSTTNLSCDMAADIVGDATEGNEFNIAEFGPGGKYYNYLDDQDVAHESIPSADTWIITDATISTFDYLAAALKVAAAQDRHIMFEFPNLTEIANMGSLREHLEHLSAPAVKKVGPKAFQNCNHLQVLDLPAIEELGMGMIGGCDALRTLNLATNEDAYISVVNTPVFAGNDVNVDEITLTIGHYDPNLITIEGNKLTTKGASGGSGEFKEIIELYKE